MINSSWKVSLKVSFIDGSLKVLTYKCHENVTDDMMIHTCRWEHNLAEEQSDHIDQVVTQSRIIKFGKKTAYSNEWQMMEQGGSFSGLDTCNHVEFGRFDKYSILIFYVERRALYNRFYINAHLNVL